MTRRRAWVVLLSALLFGGAHAAYAQVMVIQTQNLLRFGHGSRTANKCAAMITASDSVDVILIQELMTSAYPCTNLPPNFTWRPYGPKGTTSYKEYYGFLIRTTARANGPSIVVRTNTATAAASLYARPPSAILLSVTPSGGGTAKEIWLANIHSVWGKNGVTPRRSEATAAAVFFTTLKNTPVGGVTTPAAGFPVIIAGDWNLQVENALGQRDTGFDALANAGAIILPNVPTSLTKAGLQSSPYDHFAYSDISLTLTSARLFPAVDWPTWRTTTSDHLGVRVNVTFK
jgi:hypothetical protein